MHPEIESLFATEGDDFINAVLANARPLSHAKELSPEQRNRITEVLVANWPGGGFGSSFSRSGQTISSSDPWAFAWLFLGPAVDAPLTPDQWADIATSGVVMTDTAQWLQHHYSTEAAEIAARKTQSDESRNWEQLIESIPRANRLPDEVVQALVGKLAKPTQSESADFELWQIGERLSAEGRLEALHVLSQKSDELERRLLPWRAVLGDSDAARVLLEELLTGLRERRRVDRSETEWLEGVNDPALLELLFDALSEEVALDRGDPFGARGGLLRAIHRIGGEEAVRLYDEKIEGTDDSRFKFLRVPREELVQDELRRAGQQESQSVAERLGVPVLAEPEEE